jgi:putative ABC transport system permease protein
MLQDFRLAGRMLVKAPAFTTLVVVILGLGIGINTAIFSIVYAVALKPLPFAEPSRLIAIHGGRATNSDVALAYPDFVDFREQVTSIEQMAGYATGAVTLTGSGDAEGLDASFITPNFYQVLGVTPLAGRLFEPNDNLKGAAPVAILSEALWRRRFAADPAVVGRGITLDSTGFTIVGVMPQAFEFPYQADRTEIWLPMIADPFVASLMDGRGASFMFAIGRLRPGASVGQAQSELGSIAARLAQQYPASNAGRTISVVPLHDDIVDDYRRGLGLLLGAVGVVLLIACANVANLLLARGAARHKEIAIRMALGAGRARLIRQLLVESVAFSIAAGLVGIILALWGVAALVAATPLDIPRLQTAHVDTAVLAFATFMSMATGIVFGVAPALQLSRPDHGEALNDAGRGSSGARAARTGRVLVVAEIALSLVLLTGAGLMVRSFLRLQLVEPGFVPQRAVTMQLLLPGSRYPDAAAQVRFFRLVHDRTAAAPGVQSAAVATTLPMSGSNLGAGFTVDDHPLANPADRPTAAGFAVSPDYFATMGIQLVRGRAFTARDDEKAPPVAIINETMAQRFWPNEDALGRRLTSYGGLSREIVGIVRDVKNRDLAENAGPQLYTPFVQTPWPFLAVVARTDGDPVGLSATLRQAISSVDPDLAAGDVRTIDDYLARSVATPRFNATLIAGFAMLALFLAGCGLYGVMSYAVVQRSREIGIRMALGAQPGDVRGMVVSQALKMGLAGLLVGLAGAFATMRLLDNLLFGVGPSDPATFAIVCGLLLGVVLVAAYLPARRATRVEPMVALRAE